MSHLAQDMHRIHQDIVHGHQEREHLLADLHHFVDDLHCQVKNKLQHLHDSRMLATQKAAAERQAFANHLTYTINHARDAFASELENAHCGWFGEQSPVNSPLKFAQFAQCQLETKAKKATPSKKKH